MDFLHHGIGLVLRNELARPPKHIDTLVSSRAQHLPQDSLDALIRRPCDEDLLSSLHSNIEDNHIGRCPTSARRALDELNAALNDGLLQRVILMLVQFFVPVCQGVIDRLRVF